MSEPPMEQKSQELFVVEYKEASENIRAGVNMYFAIFTVFMALLAGLITQFSATSIRMPQVLVSIAGLVVTFVFWTNQERSVAHVHHNTRRASELEKQLGFHLYSTRPKSPLPFQGMTFAMRLLYGVVALFWLYTLFL